MKLVLDNNILFSIMNPKSLSSYLFFSINAEFLAPLFIKYELYKHKGECLFKSGLSEQEFDIMQGEVEDSIEFMDRSRYLHFLARAINSLEDIKDSPYLALALSTNSAIWSNDAHLKQQSLVPVFTTQELLIKFLKGEI